MSERGAFISEDWWPDEADIGFAADLGFDVPDIERIAATFKDFWLSASGQNARKRSWPATWRNWCRKEADKRGKGNRAAPSQRRSSVDAGMARSIRRGGEQATLWDAAEPSNKRH